MVALHERFDLLGGEIQLGRAIRRKLPLHRCNLGEERDHFVVRALDQLCELLLTDSELLHKAISTQLEQVALFSVGEPTPYRDALLTVAAVARAPSSMFVTPESSTEWVVGALNGHPPFIRFIAFHHGCWYVKAAARQDCNTLSYSTSTTRVISTGECSS